MTIGAAVAAAAAMAVAAVAQWPGLCSVDQAVQFLTFLPIVRNGLRTHIEFTIPVT